MDHDLEEQVLNLSDVVHDEDTSDHDDTDSVHPNSSPKSSGRDSPELHALSSTVRAFPGTTEASPLNIGNEEEPYSVENLEREITTLLNQNAASTSSSLLDGASEQRHGSGNLDKDTNPHLDAIIHGSLGLNLHGLAAMLQAANNANQSDSCDALSSKNPHFTAHSDPSPHEYRNTRTAPSFHSLTAGESSEHPSRSEGNGRRKGSDDSTYLYTDDESDGDDVAGRAPDSDDRIPDTSPPNGASSPSTPAADQGGFSDINDILHHLSARLEPDHAHDGITPESSPIVSHSQDVDDASSDPISPPLPVSRAPVLQPRYALASTSQSHTTPTTARRPRGSAKEKDKGPHTCTVDDCNKTFTRKSDLARHMRIHTGERPFVCSHRNCGKTFIQRSALQVHTRVHTGEKPHSCEYPGCGKTFGDSSSLARHRRTHTGKRPYKCEDPQCEKTFTRRTTLTQHMRTHDPHWEPDPNIRYNFKSKKPKFGLEDEREIEDSVRTISAMFHGGIRPPYADYGHYNQPTGNQVSTITAGIAAAIAKVNTSGILEEDSDDEYDDDADEGSGQEIESAPDVIGPNTSSIRGDDAERSDARVPEGRITDPTVFSLPLRTKKAKDPVAGVGVKRKR